MELIFLIICGIIILKALGSSFGGLAETATNQGINSLILLGGLIGIISFVILLTKGPNSSS